MKRNCKNLVLTIALCASALAASSLLSGCAGTAGVSGLSVSGQVATGGKLIDAGVNVGTNQVTVSGLFSQGSNTYSGAVTAPVK
jgi:hypothetical protein